MTPSILYSKSKFLKLMVPYPEKEPDSNCACHACAADRSKYAYEKEKSLASALEFVEEDNEKLMRFFTGVDTINGKWWAQVDRHGVEDGQLFTVEGIEVETNYQLRNFKNDGWINVSKSHYDFALSANPEMVGNYKQGIDFRQVVRLKAKPESKGKTAIQYRNEAAVINGWADWFNIDNSDLEPFEKREHELVVLQTALHLAIKDLHVQSKDSAPPEPKEEWRTDRPVDHNLVFVSMQSGAVTVGRIMQNGEWGLFTVTGVDIESATNKVEGWMPLPTSMKLQAIADKLNQSTTKE